MQNSSQFLNIALRVIKFYVQILLPFFPRIITLLRIKKKILEMPEKNIVRRVTEYLERKNFKYLHYVHKGPFGDMIAVLDPDRQKLAVKIVRNENICPIEDQYWISLQHPNLHKLYQIITVEHLRVKLYVMPLMTRSLEDVYHDENFRKDRQSFKRMQKWFFQVLCGIEYLHKNGLSHLNVRIDNVFIDDDDNVILSDFSTLNCLTGAVSG